MQSPAALVGFIKVDTFPLRDGIPSRPVALLLFLIPQMIGGSDLCNIVHPFRPKLHLHVALRAVIKERNMQGAVAVRVHMLSLIHILPGSGSAVAGEENCSCRSLG